MTSGRDSSPPTRGAKSGRRGVAAGGHSASGPPVVGASTPRVSEYAVPDGDASVVRCPYCDRPFGRERLRRLHVGQHHEDECTDADRTAYEAAYDAESDDLFRYQLTLVAALVVLSFGFVYLYAIVLTV